MAVRFQRSASVVRLGVDDKSLEAIQQALTEQGRSLRVAIIEAATGQPDGAPEGSKNEWRAHGRQWFKSGAGGDELAGYALAEDVWANLEPTILPLLNAILRAVNKPAIECLGSV